MQPVLERKAHAEIRRQAERRDQLGCADRFVARRLGSPRRDTIPRPSRVADRRRTWGELPIGRVAERS